MSHTTVPIWWTPERKLVGVGDNLRFDPGVGPGRYCRAVEWLREVDRSIGFASFTFDIETGGSVVVAPDLVSEATTDAQKALTTVRVVDDGHTQWTEGFAIAIREIEAGRLKKVVLARQVELVHEGPIDLEALTARLAQENPTAHVFHLDGLVGASPELLVSLQGDTVTSLVLAGTAGEAAALNDDRIELEHNLAVESVANALAAHATGIKKVRSVLELGDISHLATRFEGVSGHETDVMAILTDLHPTAAVAGTPTDAAVELIRRIEPRSRGRYAGPVGWFDQKGNGEFAIALRCGQIRDNRITLYAGGGLVKGADIDSEWSETEVKLEPMLHALGVQRSEG